jgi:hypothetical protein
MRRAARTGSSCSQTTMTRHPARLSRASVSWSRRLTAANFAIHQSVLARGTDAWIGHACHQQPRMSTATSALVKATSTVRRVPFKTGTCVRYRSPRLCSSRRTASSGPVSCRRCSISRTRSRGDGGSICGVCGIDPPCPGQSARTQLPSVLRNCHLCCAGRGRLRVTSLRSGSLPERPLTIRGACAPSR